MWCRVALEWSRQKDQREQLTAVQLTGTAQHTSLSTRGKCALPANLPKVGRPLCATPLLPAGQACRGCGGASVCRRQRHVASWPAEAGACGWCQHTATASVQRAAQGHAPLAAVTSSAVFFSSAAREALPGVACSGPASGHAAPAAAPVTSTRLHPITPSLPPSFPPFSPSLSLPPLPHALPTLTQASNFGMGGWWLGGAHMKPNPQFMAEVQASVPKDTPVVVACQKGLR